jgi:hypothetical protein
LVWRLAIAPAAQPGTKTRWWHPFSGKTIPQPIESQTYSTSGPKKQQSQVQSGPSANLTSTFCTVSAFDFDILHG